MIRPTASRSRPRGRSSLLAGGLLVAAALGAVGPTSIAQAAAPETTTAVNVRNDAGYDAKPMVALSDDGTVAVAVWIKSTGSTGPVEVATASIDGSEVTWSDPVELGTGPSGWGASVDITADGTTALVAWPSSSGPRSALATIADGEATWGAAIPITDVNGYYPRVKLSDDGATAVAVWVEGIDYSVDSAVATIDSGALTWGTSTTLSSDTSGTVRSLDVELAADGSFTAVSWSYQRQFDPNYRALLAWTPIDEDTRATSWPAEPLPLSDGATENAWAVGVEMTADASSATVVWGVKNEPDHKIYAMTGTRSNAGFEWGDTVTAATTTNSPGEIDFDASADGSRLLVAWYDGFTTGTDSVAMAGTVSGDSSTWGAPTSLHSAEHFITLYPRVALSSDGTRAVAVAIVFETASTSAARARAATVSGTAVSWSESARLTPAGDGGALGVASVAMASDGLSAVTMWQQYSPTYTSYVAASLLRPGGPPPSAKPSGAEIAHITRGDASAVVVADDPADDGGSAVTRHQARCTDGTTTRTSTASAKKRHVVTGLTNRVRWECSVRAGNSEGWSQWSPTKHIKPSTRPARDPQPPELKSVSPLSGGAIVRLDLPPKRGGSTVVGYEARCVRGDAVVRDDTAGQKRFEFSGLTPGVTWKCSGRVRTGVGWSSWATPALEVVPGPVDR